MEWKPALKRKVYRPAAQVVSKVVTRAIGPRLSALEEAHGVTWLDVQALKAVEPPDARLAALEAALAAAEQETRHEVEELRASIREVLAAVSHQHALTRAAVRAENELRQVAEELAKRLDEFDPRAEPPR